jgi:hypothetical protein
LHKEIPTEIAGDPKAAIPEQYTVGNSLTAASTAASVGENYEKL